MIRNSTKNKFLLSEFSMSVSFVAMKIIIFVLYATFIKCAFCEYFSSTDELRNLVKNDEKFLNSMKDLLHELERTSLHVKK